MATKVHMEALSPTMEEGQLVRWLKKEGDAISEGDVLAEIETDKATMELVARGSGVLQGVKLKDGETAPVGQVIAMIGEAGEAGDDADDADASADGAAPDAGVDAGDADDAEDAGDADDAEDAGDDGDAEDADADADDDAADDDAADDVAADDDAADDDAADDAEVEGDEGDRDRSEKGSERPNRQESKPPKAEETGARGKATGAESKEAGGAPKTDRAQQRGPAARVKASPLARRLAEESGLELSEVDGTGPGGRITKRDIEAAVRDGGTARRADAPDAAPDAAAAPAAASGAGARPGAGAGAEAGAESEEVPVTQMRKAIAKRLAQSIGPIPTFYLTIEADMTRLTELRARANKRLEQDGVKASINDFIIKAVAAALARHPEVNASWGDNVIHRHRGVHIGVAVAIDDGLITPIIRDADRKRVRDIAVEVKELAARAREKKLKPEEYTGATFSISNLGMFGIVEFTAIINPPEAGILAVGAVEEKPVVENGEVVVQQRMRMTMSCDHRVIDGAMGAKFLQTLQELIEDPMLMIA